MDGRMKMNKMEAEKKRMYHEEYISSEVQDALDNLFSAAPAVSARAFLYPLWKPISRAKRSYYIFEFKLDKTADEALAQIEDNRYAATYKADPREVIEIGVNFRTDQRNIGEWKMKRI